MEAIHLSEPSLVRLVINAHQGVESSLISIEKLSPFLVLTSADRTSHTIPNLWTRCLSSVALGNLLNTVGQFGCIIFLLRMFVNYFTKPEIFGGIENESSLHNFGLVNQAFAISVGKLIEGYISALNTLSASVALRRLQKENVKGCLTGIGNSEITLLELYLHTTGLRTQMEALGNLCRVNHLSVDFPASSLEVLTVKANLEFASFPRSGALLSFLYAQLKVADPENCALLKFLFFQSYEPYYGFIRSWIYEGTTNDPYNEFVVDSIDKDSMYESIHTGIDCSLQLTSNMVRDDTDIPCFLEDCLVPLVRTGQQIQLIMKLLKLSNAVNSCDAQEQILPSLIDLSIKHPWFAVPFTFDKGCIEAMVNMRANYYEHMFGKIERIMNELEFRNQQAGRPSFSLGLLNNVGDNIQRWPSSAFNGYSTPQSGGNFRTTSNSIMDSEPSSSISEYSFAEDNLKSSDSSSSESSEAPNENKNLDSVEAAYLSDLLFPLTSSSYSVNSRYQADNSCFVEKYESDFAANLLQYEANLLNMDQKLSQASGIWCTDREHDMCLCYDQPHNGYELASGTSCFRNPIFDSCINASHESNKSSNQYQPSSKLETVGLEIWKQRYDSEILSSHRLLKRSDFFNPWVIPTANQHTSSIDLSFDFSIVNDPVKAFVVKLADAIVPNDAGLTSAANGVPAPLIDPRHCPSVESNSEIIIDRDAKRYSVKSPPAKNESGEECAILQSISGGFSWESLLARVEYNAKNTLPILQDKLVSVVDLPLDFVIKKSVLDEILLQYQYLSKLMIKLLTEGFKLQEHLQALRCYHFMELADWADLFIMSLQEHKWHDSEVDKRIPPIQRALELAIQRSSCAGNPNKDRLYVHLKEDQIKLFTACAVGINCFSFLGLGYQIEWPISMILTPAALGIYSDVFNFLIQMKLAIFSLNDAWVSLKFNCSGRYNGDVSQMSLMMGTRHMIYHFVSTLQQYVQMQLSQVSWHKFLISLKFKVKDLFHLEARHMDYLTESMQICFLSDETKPIASVIQNILQCAMDYRSCVTKKMFEAASDEKLVDGISELGVLQMRSIRRRFMKNLEELYLIHLISLKQSDSALSRLWDLLNYNEYYGEVMSKQAGKVNV